MGLRLYPTTNAVSGAAIGVTSYRGDWWTGTPSPFALTLDKTDQVGNGPYTISGAVSGNVGDKIPLQTAVYELPADKTFTGTMDICFPNYGGVDAAAVDCHWVVHAYIHVGVTGALRGTLLNDYVEPSGATNALSAVPGKAQRLIDPVTITNVTASAGDYLVVEIGAVMLTAPANTGRVMAHGTRTLGGAIMADLAENDSYDFTNGSGSAWIEFIGTPVDPPPLVGTVPSCCDPGPSAVDPTAAGGWVPMCASGGEVDTVSDLTDGEFWG